MDDLFLARLLSDNSNGPSKQANENPTSVEDKSKENQITFQGLNVSEESESKRTCNSIHLPVGETSLMDKNDTHKEMQNVKKEKGMSADSIKYPSQVEINKKTITQIEGDINAINHYNDQEDKSLNTSAPSSLKSKTEQDAAFLDIMNSSDKTTAEEPQMVSLQTQNQTAVTTTTEDACQIHDQIPSTPADKSLVVESSEKIQSYREDVDSSDDDTSTFSGTSSSDCSDSFFDKMHRSCSPSNKIPNIKTKGELDLDELPLIEDLAIDVTEREMQKIGIIYAIVDKLVIVRALKDLQPLDLDSVLFLSFNKPLGRIFDVFGPVVEPFYSVRFNSQEHIKHKNVIVDSDVFFAPEKTDITSYVFVDQLRKQKGSDASWQHNNEPPEEYLDYSDDDEERAAKRKRQAKNRDRQPENDDVQIIPNKVSRDITSKNPEEINPWLDMQEYQDSINKTAQQSQSSSKLNNPFGMPYIKSPSLRPVTPANGYPSNPSARYGNVTSQTRLNAPVASQQNMLTSQQLQVQPYAFQLQQPNQSAYLQQPHLLPPRPSFLLHSPLSMPPPLHTMPLVFQRHAVQAGMAQAQIFGQAAYFNQTLPAPPLSPAAFAVRPGIAGQTSNFVNGAQNFNTQPMNSNFLNQTVNSTGQPSHFPLQHPAMLQNPLLRQGQAGSAQYQQGHATSPGMMPLTVSIPNAQPPNAMRTPAPSPYNMWGNKSLNFPQSGYFRSRQ